MCYGDACQKRRNSSVAAKHRKPLVWALAGVNPSALNSQAELRASQLQAHGEVCLPNVPDPRHSVHVYIFVYLYICVHV